MDPPTHGLMGAVVGQAFFAPRLGRRALGWGAAFNMLPDVDVAVIPLLGELAEWRYHRGLTHALWFGPVAGAALGWAVWRWRGRGGVAGPLPWMLLAVLNLMLHPLMDAFTSYGTVLLWPSVGRFAWDGLAIIDVLFSGALLLALVLGARWRGRPRRASAAAVAALLACAGYEAYGVRLNARAEAEARRQLAGVPALSRAEVHGYPVLFLPWLRRVVAREGGMVAVGWVNAAHPGPIRWHTLEALSGPPQPVQAARRLEDVRMFEWFAMGRVAAEARPASEGWTVELDDLRFGFPHDPAHGIWGVRVRVDEEGLPLGEVERIRRPPPPPVPTLRWIWRWNVARDGEPVPSGALSDAGGTGWERRAGLPPWPPPAPAAARGRPGR